MKTKHYPDVVISKADALPDELKAEGEGCDFWAYASVEAKDRDGDIVRVKGIQYKGAGGKYPPLLAGHLRVLPDGTSPIVGLIKTVKPCVHKDLGTPALAIFCKFIGTPLGQHYKGIHDEGALNGVSIGFRPTKAEPMKDGGYDFLESELLEVSIVTIPANEHAAVQRAFEETYPEAKPKHEMTVKVDVSDLRDVLQSISDKIKSLDLRLDDLEDAIAGSSQAAEQSAGHNPPPSEKSESDLLPVLRAINDAIQAIGSRK